MSNLAVAIQLATQAHRGQFRNDRKTPYIEHPIAVMNLVKQWGCDEETQIVAVLHDVIEDTPLTIKDLRACGFSENVLFSVSYLTKVSGVDYNDYIAGVSGDPIARTVKLADLEHNLSDLKHGSLRDKYLVTRMYLREIASQENKW